MAKACGRNVQYRTHIGKYVAQVSIRGQRIHLGVYESAKQARDAVEYAEAYAGSAKDDVGILYRDLVRAETHLKAAQIRYRVALAQNRQKG